MATNVLQHAKIDPQFSSGYSFLHTAMTRHGRSPWSQVRRSGSCATAPGRLRLDEYYYYGLYDDRRFAYAEKERFLGRTVQDQIIRQCNAAEWWFVAHDKPVCYGSPGSACRPRNAALHYGAGRFAAVPAFATPEALAAHLRDQDALPVLREPQTASAAGVAAVEHYADAGERRARVHGRQVACARRLHPGDRALSQGRLPVPGNAVSPSELAAVRPAFVHRASDCLARAGRAGAVSRALEDTGRGQSADNFWRLRQSARRSGCRAGGSSG